MSEQTDAILQKLLTDAAAQWSPGKRLGSEEVDKVRRFLPLYYRHTDPEELAGQSPEQICGAAEAHRAFAAERRPGRAKVRTYTPTQENDGWEQQNSVVEIVTDNAPFLVSSVTMALDELGAGIRRVIHPQLTVDRDIEGRLLDVDPEIGGEGMVPTDESWIHIEIDLQSDPARRKETTERLEQVLADARHVDEDNAKMQDRITSVADELADHPDRLVAGGVDEREIDESVDFLRWVSEHHFTFLG